MKEMHQYNTNANEQRDALDDILVKGNKLLFSVNPSEGDSCYQNIIQVGRFPNQYVAAATTSAIKRTNRGVIVTVNNTYNLFYLYFKQFCN